MKKIIDDNHISAQYFEISGNGIIPEEAILRSIAPAYRKNEDGSERVLIGWIVECVDGATASIFKLKVENTEPVISPEDFENAEDLIWIRIPVDKCRIRPYAIEYGRAKVSVTVPYIFIKEDK